jgi:hypothetical protein
MKSGLNSIDPESVLKKFREGNKRYVAGITTIAAQGPNLQKILRHIRPAVSVIPPMEDKTARSRAAIMANVEYSGSKVSPAFHPTTLGLKRSKMTAKYSQYPAQFETVIKLGNTKNTFHTCVFTFAFGCSSV